MGGQTELVRNHLAGRDPFAQCSLETGGSRDLESEWKGIGRRSIRRSETDLAAQLFIILPCFPRGFLMWKCISPESGNCWVEVWLAYCGSHEICCGLFCSAGAFVIWHMKLAQELLNLPFKLIFGEAEPLRSESVKQRWPRNDARSRLDGLQ